jgi:hypothetical protein
MTDPGVNNSFLAGIYGVRNGGDTTGNLEFYTNNSGSFTSKGRFLPDGTLELDGDLTTPGLLSLTKGIKHTEDADISSYTKVATKYDHNNPKTGTLVIDLPTGASLTRMAIKIRGFNYSSDPGGAWELLIGGLHFTSGEDLWYHYHASVTGDVIFDQIRVGYNGNTNKSCIMIGETSTSWVYPLVEVSDVLAAEVGSTFNAWESGWVIDYYTDETEFYNNDGNQADPQDVPWSRDYEAPSEDNQVLVSTASKQAAWSTAGNDQYLASDASGDVSWADKVWTETLSANMTLYVTKSGNDSTGDGSIGDPYLTIAKVIEVIGKLYIGDYEVTVDIGEGVFTEANTITFMHPFGSQVTFQGVSERIDSQDIASTSGGVSYGFDNLYYRPTTIVLPVGKSVSVGDYIGIATATGGINPEALLGMHKVSGWDGGTRTATIEAAYRNGSGNPSGLIVVDIDLVKTVIAFSDKNGIKISGPYYGGTWRGLVIQGSWNGSNNAEKGIWSINSAAISISGSDTSGYACGVVGFQIGIYAQNNATVFADYGYTTKMGQHAITAQNGGILSLRNTRVSACNNSGLYAFNGSTVAASYIQIATTGDVSVLSYQGSFIDFRFGSQKVCVATTGVMADRWSGIDGTSATVDDAISPVTDGNNDGSYVINL